MKASIVDLRYRMKDVLRAIDRGETVTVLYRGKPRALLEPVGGHKPTVKTEDTPFFGMWADREDMADPAAYIRKLREPRFARLYEEGASPAPKAGRKPKSSPPRRKRVDPAGRKARSR